MCTSKLDVRSNVVKRKQNNACPHATWLKYCDQPVLWLTITAFHKIVLLLIKNKIHIFTEHFHLKQTSSFFRLAITQPPPAAVPTAHIGQWLARAGGVSSLLCGGGVRAGLHGWPIPWRNVWGPAHPFILQLGERHAPDSGGDTHTHTQNKTQLWLL